MVETIAIVHDRTNSFLQGKFTRPGFYPGIVGVMVKLTPELKRSTQVARTSAVETKKDRVPRDPVFLLGRRR